MAISAISKSGAVAVEALNAYSEFEGDEDYEYKGNPSGVGSPATLSTNAVETIESASQMSAGLVAIASMLKEAWQHVLHSDDLKGGNDDSMEGFALGANLYMKRVLDSCECGAKYAAGVHAAIAETNKATS